MFISHLFLSHHINDADVTRIVLTLVARVLQSLFGLTFGDLVSDIV